MEISPEPTSAQRAIIEAAIRRLYGAARARADAWRRRVQVVSTPDPWERLTWLRSARLEAIDDGV